MGARYMFDAALVSLWATTDRLMNQSRAKVERSAFGQSASLSLLQKTMEVVVSSRERVSRNDVLIAHMWGEFPGNAADTASLKRP